MILVGMAVAALSGCVSVETQPPAPEPPKEVSRPSEQVDVAPQIVEGPAREALEAALPPPPSPRATPGQRKGKGKVGAGASTGKQRPPSVPHQHARVPAVKVPDAPEPPRSRADVCALGEQYGGWHPGSDQARVCRGTYGK
ncbi:hypothetical protein [Streptomyces sp. NBC_01353]|uniref:hypothetical protein n=1 Tax=Streptomyces sp. NBC_01353 TaxID=2903835 RepID=UPI002E381189|nr:hypothetical protein [Streptomyces sp. NBC_01353]